MKECSSVAKRREIGHMVSTGKIEEDMWQSGSISEFFFSSIYSSFFSVVKVLKFFSCIWSLGSSCLEVLDPCSRLVILSSM